MAQQLSEQQNQKLERKKSQQSLQASRGFPRVTLFQNKLHNAAPWQNWNQVTMDKTDSISRKPACKGAIRDYQDYATLFHPLKKTKKETFIQEQFQLLTAHFEQLFI